MQGHILLVEDESNMAKMQAKILHRKGYTVEAVCNGQEALRLLDQTNFDVVITDLKMPVMDGMQLLHEMRVRACECPVIVLTGHGTIESAVEAMQRGATDYLTKPCNPDELLLKVEKLVETRRLRRELAQLRREVQSYKRFGENGSHG